MTNDRRPVSARIQHLPKPPPHSIESEQSVIGGIMLNNKIWNEVADKLVPEDFYRSDHRLIFSAVCELVGAGKECDFVTLAEHLRHSGKLEEAGGAQYLGSLAADTYSIANVIAYAEIVRERSVMRGLIAAGADIGDLGYRTDGRALPELLEAAEQLVHGLRRRDRHDITPIGSLIESVNQRIDAARAGKIIRLQTGYSAMDQRVYMEAGDLIIVAARPGQGKTSLALGIAEHVSITDHRPVAVFSMEMSSGQLVQRLLSSYGRVPLAGIRSGRLNDMDMDRLVSAQAMLREAPIYIDESGALTPLEFRARARRLVAKHKVELIVVDYLQLMQAPGNDNRTNEIGAISRSMKATAKELGVPIIALSQLNRGVENRENKRPRLADLRESGNLEQDADVVLFIYRDEMYDEHSAHAGKAEIIIGKYRNGATGHFDLSFIGKFAKFDNLADHAYGE